MINPVLLLLLFLTFSALVANPKKTTLHGGQSRSWSAEQGKKEKEKVWQRSVTPAGASNELDVQNEWEENTQTQNFIELATPLDHRLVKFCGWRVL